MKKQKKDIVEKLTKKIEENKKNITEKEEQKKEEKSTNKKSMLSKIINDKNLKKLVGIVEATIYIVCIIAVIFANLYAPIYIQMIPLLFILGIVGKLVYDRPVTTTVFGLLVAICAVYTTGIRSISQNLLISSFMAIYIALGEICAFALQKSYAYIKKKSKRVTKKAIISYCIFVLTFVVSLGIYNYTNSNYFELDKSEKRLNEYLAKNYDGKNFEIVDVEYNFLGEKCFTFDIKEKDEERIYEFIVSKDIKFAIDDGYVKYEKANRQKEANEKLINFLKDNKLNEKYSNVKVGIKLNEVDDLELEITKEVETITEENTLEFAKQVAGVINDIKEFEYFKEFEQIILSLKNKQNLNENLTSYLFIERYLNNDSLDIANDYEYINKSLNVEYID